MTQRRIVIAGTGSGVGKTTLTIGLMAALRRKGLKVQGFKCGPDTIDASYHTAVCGRVSRNLDSWMLNHEVMKEIYAHGSEDADISVIEGVMGFYDGKSPLSNHGSTAQISQLTESPVILVVDCFNMARSAAAVVKGFQCFAEDSRIAGVIANRVGGEGHFHLVQQAIQQECGIPVIGYLPYNEKISVPERHLGLIPALERGELDSFFSELGDLVGQFVDLEQVIELAAAPPVKASKQLFKPQLSAKERVKIAVAKDAAFHFYYPENLELLEWYGAQIVFFSPLAGQLLPDDVHGLYLGGGLPEEFAAQLSGDLHVKQSIAKAITNGLPTLAECGGFMYLNDTFVTTGGERFPMVGLIPGTVTMQPRLAAVGYREVSGLAANFLLPPGELARGHEFHYAKYVPAKDFSPAYDTTVGRTAGGYAGGNLVASFTQIHFASHPAIVERWLNKCREVLADGKSDADHGSGY